MALHCFNLFFPCTNILQVKCMHLHCTFRNWRQNSQQFRDSECVRNIRRARGMCRVAAVTLEREGWVYVRPISSHSYWLECWQCRQECGDRSTLSHTHTPVSRRDRASAKHGSFMFRWNRSDESSLMMLCYKEKNTLLQYSTNSVV